MKKNYANRPSQANQEYVINSQGNKVKNIAYNPIHKNNDTKNNSISFIQENAIKKYDLELKKINTVLEGLHYDKYSSTYDDYALHANILTVKPLERKGEYKKEHEGISGYLFMVGDTLNMTDEDLSDKAKEVRNEKLEIIHDDILPVQGIVWRGIPTNQYKEEYGEFIKYLSTPEELDKYVENNIDNIIDDSKWCSYSMSPGVALSFSYGAKRTMDKMSLSKASYMSNNNIYDGVIIAQVNPEGYQVEYPDRNNKITINNDNCEYEILIPPQDNKILKIISAKDSPFKKPIVIVTKENERDLH